MKVEFAKKAIIQSQLQVVRIFMNQTLHTAKR